MPSVLLHKVTPVVLPSRLPKSLGTRRALRHDLRQPFGAIRQLADARGGDARRRFDGILEEAPWLSEMVDGVIGGAADDLTEGVDVVDLVAHCVRQAQPTATCHIRFLGTVQAMTVASPVALSRAVGFLLHNAVRAAGHRGQVTVKVTGTDSEINVWVIDDGPGLGSVPTNNELGLIITRALVSACGGGLELKPGRCGGVVARIALPAMSYRAVPS